MNPFSVPDIVRLALLEDLGPGDLTSALIIPPATIGQARLVTGDFIVVSGLEAAVETIRQVDPRIIFTPIVRDGDRLAADEVIAEIEGPAASILTAERLTINFLARLSGIATMTARYVAAAGNPAVRVLDTRETSPGLRILEKAAVRHGGGRNGRLALFDGIMIKHNHVVAAGSIAEAIERARVRAPRTIKIEVEAGDLTQLNEALEAGADIILLKDMPPETLAGAVKTVDDYFAPRTRRVLLGALGATLDTINAVAATGVDYIPISAITSSAPAVDISLEWD
ncbi:nicotinate-nucleotide diphosphorylase (carboxylating) [Deltaproteobacteria bacterium Smac51]|nr:nicotinate-nucleotide diphosphorylase (carboxylating) [Deltaproteobacteria bacterium Smac51]